MASWIRLVHIFFCIIQVSSIEQIRTFQSDTELNHLTINGTGTVYIGAVNRLYQLTGELEVLVNVTTGPKEDNKKCTPPIDTTQCSSSVLTDNYNKLLLLDVPNSRIVVCGSIFKGICSLRHLSNISEQISYDDSRGEKSFVASNDEKVETVGLVTDMKDNGSRVLFVGKGASPNDNGIMISTRLLDEMEDKGPFETVMDSAAYKFAYSSANTQQFVTVFEHSHHVYFIHSLLDKNSGKNRTFVTRLCKADSNYFSYVEMDLLCTDRNIPYNICTSAYLARPGHELASVMGISGEDNDVLFAVFSTFDNNQEKSALCMYSLEDINKQFEKNRELCYTSTSEPLKEGEKIFTKPFGDGIGCGGKKNPISDESIKYPCGSEHLPYPLQSKEGVVASAVLVRENNLYTSVAVTVENGHTIAFLGTAEGKLLKAFLGKYSREYRVQSFDTKSTVKNGMVFDATKEHIYVMTKKKVHRVPVQDCHRYLTCNECTQAKDPYCGWCVIDGKCSLKEDCGRATEPNHWLWSPDGVCLKIDSAQPSNMSVRHLSDVILRVTPSISLHEDDELTCNFGGHIRPAILESDGSFSCPHPHGITATEPGHDYVNVSIQLFVTKKSVFFAEFTYQFYNCEESMNLSGNLPCISCVTTQWECEWDVKSHKCVDRTPDNEPSIIRQEDDCPQFFQQIPSFIPMDLANTIQFYGKNLEPFKECTTPDFLRYQELWKWLHH